MLERRKVMLGCGAAAMGCLLLSPFVSAAAEPLPKARDEILLTIDGAITVTNGDGLAAFDLDMLKALPSRQFVTTTPWTKGLHTFTGVPLGILMARVGATGTKVTATALNDYSADVPIADGEQHEAMVAYLFDGQPMLASDHGPLWIIYPFSNREETQTETFYIRAVWNLYNLTVR
jgi:hypothetical protein